MRFLRQIFFAMAIVAGAVIAASAQNGGQNPPPKQGEQPKIKVPEDKKPPPTPKDPPKDKKPGFALVERKKEITGNIV